jgi:hypothetical protein
MLPVTTSPAQLEVTLQDSKVSDADRLHCAGASCRLIQTPQLVQPITWLPTP